MTKQAYTVSNFERFLMRFTPYQLYRFCILNLKMLRAIFAHPAG